MLSLYDTFLDEILKDIQRPRCSHSGAWLWQNEEVTVDEETEKLCNRDIRGWFIWTLVDQNTVIH